mmetsp:Transcript_11205/g.32505  ORF Transcript_11205/g.32505 Transcript_11205/m.32505 type:complete len:274 (+) Transcript_11205:636-1457(+)
MYVCVCTVACVDRLHSQRERDEHGCAVPCRAAQTRLPRPGKNYSYCIRSHTIPPHTIRIVTSPRLSPQQQSLQHRTASTQDDRQTGYPISPLQQPSALSPTASPKRKIGPSRHYESHDASADDPFLSLMAFRAASYLMMDIRYTSPSASSADPISTVYLGRFDSPPSTVAAAAVCALAAALVAVDRLRFERRSRGRLSSELSAVAPSSDDPLSPILLPPPLARVTLRSSPLSSTAITFPPLSPGRPSPFPKTSLCNAGKTGDCGRCTPSKCGG